MTHRQKRAIVLAVTPAAVVCLIGGGGMRAAAEGKAGTSISATVSAAGYFTRTNTYTWKLDQSVSPSNAQLAIGSSQNFTHALTACRTLASQVDSPYGV